MGLFVPLGLDYFLFHVGEIFTYIVFKIFLIVFLFLFFFWDSYYSNVSMFDIVLEFSESILCSFHSFYFILLFRSYYHHLIFQLTESFFCLTYSAIDSFWDFYGVSDSKASAYSAGDPGLFPGSGRSPGEGNGNPFQHSGLENPMDGGA